MFYETVGSGFNFRITGRVWLCRTFRWVYTDASCVHVVIIIIGPIMCLLGTRASHISLATNPTLSRRLGYRKSALKTINYPTAEQQCIRQHSVWSRWNDSVAPSLQRISAKPRLNSIRAIDRDRCTHLWIPEPEHAFDITIRYHTTHCYFTPTHPKKIPTLLI